MDSQEEKSISVKGYASWTLTTEPQCYFWAVPILQFCPAFTASCEHGPLFLVAYLFNRVIKIILSITWECCLNNLISLFSKGKNPGAVFRCRSGNLLRILFM